MEDISLRSAESELQAIISQGLQSCGIWRFIRG